MGRGLLHEYRSFSDCIAHSILVHDIMCIEALSFGGMVVGTGMFSARYEPESRSDTPKSS